ncbi:MAG TPA: SMP-30/gluconolactonase/LRE family protein [Povalibacter sp.]|uniref:SMP-30/gluconolactonase/LRE family protein n=1 Tax=Povalibacter sp. TaxID=1962978 RepID=UPI002BB79E2A|nr:SMP-30/gluconolactonase/LRE family protein [Povalibacter sp.]HMN46006.1 SMP-30/gluconolactonase/LRE family protein [Povalibacter sp.]
MQHARRVDTLVVALAWTFCADAAPVSESHQVERLVAGSPFHGVHGLAFDRNDVLHAGSVMGQSVYRVDTATGAVETVVGPPAGMADDLVFLADGTMVWTAILQGAVYARSGDGPVRKIADIPSINSINVRRSDGRLFVGQVFGGDGVWEIDPAGIKPPRSIVKDPGGFNGFDIGPDGMLYGPLWFKKQIVRIDPDSGAMSVVADGFQTPAAANFDSKWNLYVVDTAAGELIRVDIERGTRTLVAKLETSLDNLAIDSRDRIFVSNMADNGIQEVDAVTGKVRQVVKGELAIPLSIAAHGTTIYVADVFAFRSVDGRSGAVDDIARAHAAGTPIEYPVAVSASEHHVVLVNSEGLVQKYPHGSNRPAASMHLRGARLAYELPGGDGLVLTADNRLVRLASGDGNDKGRVIDGNVPASGGFALSRARRNTAYALDAVRGEILQLDLLDGQRRVIAKGLTDPRSLAVGANDALFTVELSTRRLIQIDSPSGTSRVIASDLPVGGADNPTAAVGIAVDDGDAVYVSSDVENSLWRFTPKRVH